MNIVFVLTLVACLHDLSIATHLRENSNVLVPDNDVNLHDKIKNLLKIDSEDFNEHEVSYLKQLKISENEKLHKENEESVNFVNDAKNKNNEDNQIDRDVSIFEKIGSDDSDLFGFNFTISENETATKVSEITSDDLSTYLNAFNSTSTSDSSPLEDSTTKLATTPEESTIGPKSSEPSSTASSSTLPTEYKSPTTPSTLQSTTNEPLNYDDIQSDECLSGKSDGIRIWIDDAGFLNETVIKGNFGTVKIRDLTETIEDYGEFLKKTFGPGADPGRSLSELVFLSLAYNKLDRLPHELLSPSSNTLQYLSLTGNSFAFPDTSTFRDPERNFISLHELKELDMRRCQIQVIGSDFVKKLAKLEYLYLSHNEIKVINERPFPPRMRHINLSYNNGSDILNMKLDAFQGLQELETLDFSFTKLEMKTVVALPTNLKELSLCYTDLPQTGVGIFNGLQHIRYLDISGNPRWTLSAELFEPFAESLRVLYIRNAAVKNLEWTLPLKNLELFDLLDNNIHTVKNISFSHMTKLLKLNLEKNSIGNWYERLFDQNQRLDILNLRANKLTLLTNDMKEDLASVKYLAMGNNDFECTCVLQEFMHKIFSATENADVMSLRFDNEISYDEFEKEFFERIEDTTRVSLGVRNYIRPEYDVISRAYQKYNDMAEKSVQALKNRVTVAAKPKSLVNKSKAYNVDSEPTTVLFDYDEKDYKCMNATEKKQRPIIELTDLCHDEFDEENGDDDGSPYAKRKNSSLLVLSVSIPLVITLSVLVMLAYWKWWYIKYFFVLCKNSAILTFMDDAEGGKDAIIKRRSSQSVDSFLYDVFVSYSEQNREWVLDEFIPNVEKRESINVCLHERDFQVGYGILENIVSCMDRSRCLLLLVSKNFLLSQWCQFEMNLAQHRLLETRREKLILVLLEDIPARKQPKTLKYLMRTKTYIKWPQNGNADERQVFWKRLKKAIISSKWENDSYGSIV